MRPIGAHNSPGPPVLELPGSLSTPRYRLRQDRSALLVLLLLLAAGVALVLLLGPCGVAFAVGTLLRRVGILAVVLIAPRELRRRLGSRRGRRGSRLGSRGTCT